MSVARKMRAVSTRTATRQLSQLLDEIERDESAILIVRYGRPVGMLVPFEETGQTVTLPRIADLALLVEDQEDEIGDEEIERLALDPLCGRILLDMLHCTALTWHISRMAHEKPLNGLYVALTRLEFKDLIMRHRHGGFELTKRGTRVARKLDSGS